MHPTPGVPSRSHLRCQVPERLIAEEHALAKVRPILQHRRSQSHGEAALVPARLQLAR